MKKSGKVVSLNRLNLSFLIKCDRVKMILYILSAIGLLAGFILFSKSSNSELLAKFIFNKLIAFKLRKDFALSIIIAFGSFLSVIVITVILGASVFGIIVIPAIILTVNGVFGTLLAMSYQHYQISGLAFNSVLLIPSYSVFLISLIISSTSILKYAILQFNCLVKNNNGKIAVEFSSMLRKQIMVIIILIPNAVFEVVLNNLFIKTFNFV